ncbi:MAG: FMN-binding protein [Bacteroidota bacterium]
MKIAVAILFVLLNLQIGSNINFEPRMLVKEIQKISGSDKPIPKELMVYKAGKYFSYTNAKPVSYSFVGRVFSCRTEGCGNDENHLYSANNSEFFDYFILFDSSGKILSVQVFNYEATHGQEITLKSWLNQFVGYNGSKKLTVGKEIDAISGATTSVYSITNDIVDKTAKLRAFIDSQAR